MVWLDLWLRYEREMQSDLNPNPDPNPNPSPNPNLKPSHPCVLRTLQKFGSAHVDGDNSRQHREQHRANRVVREIRAVTVVTCGGSTSLLCLLG